MMIFGNPYRFSIDVWLYIQALAHNIVVGFRFQPSCRAPRELNLIEQQPLPRKYRASRNFLTPET